MGGMTNGRTDLATLRAWLAERVASYLDMSTMDVDPAVPFAELGMGSVAAMTLCGDIEDTWHLEVDPTLAYEYPTIAAVARYLHGELAALAERAA